MYAIFIVALMGALLSLHLVSTKSDHDADLSYARADREAIAVIAYKKAIGNYICDHPIVQGSINMTDLELLPGITETKWSHHIENDTIFMYTTDVMKTRAISDALRRRFDSSSLYILAPDRSASILSASDSLIPVFPNVIPANTLVVTVPIQNNCKFYPDQDNVILLNDGTRIDLINRSVTTSGGSTITLSGTILVDGIPINNTMPTILTDKTRIATNGEILTNGPHAIYLTNTFVRIDGQDILWKNGND